MDLSLTHMNFEIIKQWAFRIYNIVRAIVREIYEKCSEYWEETFNEEEYDVMQTVTTSDGRVKGLFTMLNSEEDKQDEKDKVYTEDEQEGEMVTQVAYVFEDEDKIHVLLNAAHQDLPLIEVSKTTKRMNSLIIQNDKGVSVITNVKTPLGSVTLMTDEYIKSLDIEEMEGKYSLNPYVYIDKKPKYNSIRNGSNYIGKQAVLIIKIPNSTYDMMCTTSVYTEIAVQKTINRRRSAETIAIFTIVPDIQDALYCGCVINVKNSIFLVTHKVKHVTGNYNILMAVGLQSFDKEIKINYKPI